MGDDGIKRRWVYLHFFKPSQPALNYDHPDCQAVRLINGSIISTIYERGAKGIRLDAVPYSIKSQIGDIETDDVYSQSVICQSNQRASLIRQLGGFSFQELHAPITEAQQYIKYGADLAYDVFTRPAYLNALLTGDATLLNTYFSLLLSAGIQPKVLIHDLQNYDEFIYQFPELEVSHLAVDWHDRYRRARAVQKNALESAITRFAGKSWAKLVRREHDGVATTMVGFLCSCLDCDPYQLSNQDKERIKHLHLIAVRLNAMQPGAFCMSMWDLVGALPLRPEEIEDRLRDGDFRWINRGGVDLIGKYDSCNSSCCGLPRASTLYGSLSEQLAVTTSFASQVRYMLLARLKYGIAFGELTSPPPDSENAGVCILPVKLNSGKQFALTCLNFSHIEDAEEEVDLEELLKVDKSRIRGLDVIDISTDKLLPLMPVTRQGRLYVDIPKMGGKTLVIQSRPTSDPGWRQSS